MGPDESDKDILRNSKDSVSRLLNGDSKGKSIRPKHRQNGREQSGFGSFISMPLEGPISDDILFANEMPRAVPWSVAWADVMMTMFIIFAAMYIFKAPTREKTVIHPEIRTEFVEKIKEVPQNPGINQSGEDQSMQEIYNLSKQTLNSVSSVELVPDKAVRIILKSDLLFDKGKADIKEEAKGSLNEVADVIRQTSYMVNIVGHTDDLPINTQEFPSNWELSTIRACKVARFLMKDMNIPEDRFYVTGHAYYQPVKPNADEQDRAVNRRVEIIITKEKPHAVSSGQ
jgi:chemotaxis protein MotB